MSHEALAAAQTPEAFTDRILPQLEQLGIVQNQHERAEQLRNVTGEGLMHLIAEVHKTVAPNEVHVPHPVAMKVKNPDGSNPREMLAPEERIPLLNKAAFLIRQLAGERSGAHDDEAFLRRSGNIIGMATVLAHTYEEGNGRTARTLSQVVRYGIDRNSAENMDDLRVLSANRGENPGYRVYSYLPTKEGLDMSPDQLLEVAASVDIPLDADVEYQSKKYDAMMTPYSD